MLIGSQEEIGSLPGLGLGFRPGPPSSRFHSLTGKREPTLEQSFHLRRHDNPREDHGGTQFPTEFHEFGPVERVDDQGQCRRVGLERCVKVVEPSGGSLVEFDQHDGNIRAFHRLNE